MQSVMSINLEETDKEYFEDFCQKLGINASMAVNIFIKAIRREDKMPFEIEDPFYSEENMRVLRASVADANAGKVAYHDLIEA